MLLNENTIWGTSKMLAPAGGSALYGIGSNTLSQGIANGGDLSKVNVIEASLSAIPGAGSTIVGETFNLSVSSIMQNNFMPSTPTSLSQATLQIGGGLLSNQFGNAVGNLPLGNGAGQVYGNVAEFAIETGSNALPNSSLLTAKLDILI